VTVSFVVATVADLGLPMLASRDLPAVDDAERPRWLTDFWSVRLWSASLVTVGGVVVVAALAFDTEMTAALTVGLLAVPVILLTNAVSSLFLARLDPWPGLWTEVVSRSIWVVGVVVAVGIDASMLSILGLLVGSQAVALVVLVRAATRHGLVAVPRARASAAALVQRAAPLAVIPVLGVVYARADTLVMAALASDAETGMYGAMWRLVEVVVSFAVIGAGLLLPMLSGTDDPTQRRLQYLRAMRLLMALLVPLCAVIAVAAGPLLELFGGAGFFEPVATPWGVVSPQATLVVLMGGVVMMGFGIVHGAVMVATHRQQALIRQSVMVVVVNLALAVLLIPRLSILGAAIAVLVTEVLSLAHSLWVVRGALGRFAVGDVVLWPTLIGAAAAAAMVLAGGAPLALQALAALCAAGLVAMTSPLRAEVEALRRSRLGVAS
jgi:O-antigen/teichoic acid export membrane protein